MFSVINMQCLTSAVLIFNRREDCKRTRGKGRTGEERGAQEKGRKGGEEEEKTQGKREPGGNKRERLAI